MIRTILFLVILHSRESLLAQEPQASVPIAAQTQSARKPDNTTPSSPEGWHSPCRPTCGSRGSTEPLVFWAAMRVCMLGSEILFPSLISG